MTFVCGYYNIPREVLDANQLSPEDVHARPYRDWVRSRVELAREYFAAGRPIFAQGHEPALPAGLPCLYHAF